MTEFDTHTNALLENGSPAFAKPVLYEGEISRTTLSSKHVKRKEKMSVGNNLI